MIVAAAGMQYARFEQERAFPFAITPIDWNFVPNRVPYIYRTINRNPRVSKKIALIHDLTCSVDRIENIFMQS